MQVICLSKTLECSLFLAKTLFQLMGVSGRHYRLRGRREHCSRGKRGVLYHSQLSVCHLYHSQSSVCSLSLTVVRLFSITHSRQSVLYHSQSSVCSLSLTVVSMFSITHSHPAVLYHSQSSVCSLSLTVISVCSLYITHSRQSVPPVYTSCSPLTSLLSPFPSTCAHSTKGICTVCEPTVPRVYVQYGSWAVEQDRAASDGSLASSRAWLPPAADGSACHAPTTTARDRPREREQREDRGSPVVFLVYHC